MKKLYVILAVILTVTGLALCCIPNQYNERTRTEYRQMLGEGK